MNTSLHNIRSGRRGFTLVEMLLVVAIILLVLSILIVAIAQAKARAADAKTQTLMTSINQGLVRFREDIGYLPPVLGDANPSVPDDLRTLWTPPAPGAGGLAGVQNWYSVTSLVDYLIGPWDEAGDGAGEPNTPSKKFAGIRHPGLDGAWLSSINGAADGSVAARNTGLGAIGGQGRVYGPYIELAADRLIAAVDVGGQVRFPGDPGYDDDLPKAIVDAWGNPIRYYRRPYPPGAIKQSYRQVAGQPAPPTLSDFFALRPFDLPKSGVTDGTADGNGDTSTTLELKSGEFALMSVGPDGASNATLRIDDPEYFNEDNLVEVGR